MQRRKTWRDRGKARAPNGAARTDAIGSGADMRPLWTPQQTAMFFNTDVQTLKNARCTGVGAFASLSYLKFGRLVRYEPAVCEAYAAARRHQGPEAA